MKETPSNYEVFCAMISSDNNPDWCERILQSANPKTVQKVRNLLEQGYILPEAELMLEDLPEERT